MSAVIRTTYVYPPIPVRDFDFSATFDDFDGAPDAGLQIYGEGRTELAAVVAFYDHWEQHFDEPLCAHRPCFLEDL